MPQRPYENTSLTLFLQKRILELQYLKTQATIASEAGFINPNMLAQIKNGAARLPFDRVPALAAALDVDPRKLLLKALEQSADDTSMRAFREIIGTIVTRNEIAWIEEIRAASGNADPAVTTRSRSALRSIFGR
ncbi:helix-turn-helix transcriptional regulator [Devosia sp. YR412]|uniref:helix-turn-helix transcriptional regulator n=1 Tax=Devosia sp. YR412 TaxID=1881030 RepID=UPI000B830CFF|nr:helix-turn-helix transcriptional regulator [Devosia sp. YR412]